MDNHFQLLVPTEGKSQPDKRERFTILSRYGPTVLMTYLNHFGTISRETGENGSSKIEQVWDVSVWGLRELGATIDAFILLILSTNFSQSSTEGEIMLKAELFSGRSIDLKSMCVYLWWWDYWNRQFAVAWNNWPDVPLWKKRYKKLLNSFHFWLLLSLFLKRQKKKRNMTFFFSCHKGQSLFTCPQKVSCQVNKDKLLQAFENEVIF